LLDKRGDFLGVGKFKEAAEIDKKILKYLKDNMDRVTTPVSAFVTFTTQEAQERCNKYLFAETELGYSNADQVDINILGQPAQINQAPEPTNVIWEDLGITGNRLLWNSIKANCLMFILVLAGFTFFWILKTLPNEVRKEFPTTAHCEDL
jgi:hypothetical protein